MSRRNIDLERLPTRFCHGTAVVLLVLGMLDVSVVTPASKARALPFDRSNPFIWDNDSERDVVSLALVMAAAQNRDITLAGISRSPQPFATAVNPEDYQTWVRAARDSGWHNIPDATSDLGAYFMTALQQPATRSIDDTQPIDTPAARMMMNIVLSRGTRERPVVIGTGGALTTVASAYLLALKNGQGETFTAHAIVCAAIGSQEFYPELKDYNSLQDEWAVYVVLTRLRTVLSEADSRLAANQGETMWRYVASAPDNPIGRYLRYTQDVTWPPSYSHKDIGGDIGPLIALLHSSRGLYFTQLTGVRFDSWKPWPEGYPTHGPHDPAVPNQALNWNAFQQIAVLTGDSGSDDVYISSYNSHLAVSTFIDVFDRAFSRPTPQPHRRYSR